MQTSVVHRVEPSGISYVELSGDQQAMREWLGSEAAAQLALKWSQGPPGINAVGIKTSQGEAVMKSP